MRNHYWPLRAKGETAQVRKEANVDEELKSLQRTNGKRV